MGSTLRPLLQSSSTGQEDAESSSSCCESGSCSSHDQLHDQLHDQSHGLSHGLLIGGCATSDVIQLSVALPNGVITEERPSVGESGQEQLGRYQLDVISESDTNSDSHEQQAADADFYEHTMLAGSLGASPDSRTCRLVTLGCKVNQYETQLVKEALEKNGFREAQEGENADVCVVNTCTVTNEGDYKSRKIIRALARQNPGTRTIVMGCYATREPEEVRELPSVFEVVTDKRELPDILSRHGIYDIPNGISYFEGRKRAYVKVQDGCILKCTYCIIPQVRPGLHSRTPEDIEQEVRRLVENGYKEIVLAGIHVGHYGVESTRRKSGLPPFRLWHLFRLLDKIPGDWRMRLSSIEANEVDDDFMKAAADCEHLCHQFHPALQSGSDGVLTRMRRRYRVAKFLEKLDRMRDMIPEVAYTTDVIVGFPGETEDEFQETMRTCEQAQFMKMHLFPFSPRRSTPAAKYPDQISPEVRKDRMQRLSVLERELAVKYYQRHIGHHLDVLVERVCEETPGMVRGTDRYYMPVTFPGTAADLGQMLTVVGHQASRDSLQAIR